MQREVEEKLDDHLLNYNLFGFFDHFFKLKREVQVPMLSGPSFDCEVMLFEKHWTKLTFESIMR